MCSWRLIRSLTEMGNTAGSSHYQKRGAPGRADINDQLGRVQGIDGLVRVLLLAVLALFASEVHAPEYTLGKIKIGHPWARPTSEGTKTAAVCLSLENNGSEPMPSLAPIAKPQEKLRPTEPLTREAS